MALLYAPRFQALDASANPIAGARLYTFDSVSTTTPKATYSDNALAVSNGAYVLADSSGVFPPIFGSANESYYMVLKTPAGVTVDEFPFVTTLGPDSSSVLLKDLGTNGRFQVSGVGGVVQIETANAEGDDIGGSGRIGGFNNTQGDALEIDYAATSVMGSLAVADGLDTAGMISFDVSAVPALDIDLTTGPGFTKAISANSTFTFSGSLPDNGCAFVVKLTITASAVDTWPAAVDFENGAKPTLGDGVHYLSFITLNSGTQWLMKVVGRAVA